MRIYLFTLILVLAAGIAGCKVSSTDTVTTHISTHTSDGSIALHAPGHPDANVTAVGDLSVGDTKVTVTPEQRELLMKYYVTTAMMRDHGITAGNADFASQATLICTELTDLKSTNEKLLASQLRAFEPYADTINADQKEHCGKK